MESFGVKEIIELVPGGKDIVVTDDNKEDYLQVRTTNSADGGRGFAEVLPHGPKVKPEAKHQKRVCSVCGLDPRCCCSQRITCRAV